MKRTALAAALLCAAVASACPAFAADGIQMLPPTPLGSTAACPTGLQQILSYSGTATGGPQGGINCVPIATDAAGDMVTSGFVQVGNTGVACTTQTAGAMRFNPATGAFEGCNGSGWSAIGSGGGNGKLHWSGAWTGDDYWCDSGYHVVGFHYDCGCSNNATWFECQSN